MKTRRYNKHFFRLKYSGHEICPKNVTEGKCRVHVFVSQESIMATSTDDRGLKHDRYMRFLASAAESEYLNTVHIHIATGGNAMVGYYPIRRASYLAQRLQEYPYDNLVPLW